MTTRARPGLLLLGICAGWHRDFDVWVASGVLPTLQRLFAAGVSGRVDNVPAVYEQCAWPSFYTGTGPARQGVHSWQQLVPGTYEFRRDFTPDVVRTPPFWDRLSDAGRRVAILDVPETRPSLFLNGIQLVEWGAHDINHGFMTSPPSLAQEIIERFGRHPQHELCDAERSAAEIAAFRDGLLRGIDAKVAITRHFLNEAPWDFFTQVFTEFHCIGHQAWHLHDPVHPRFRPEDRAAVGDPVRDVYVRLDAAIGEILADVDPATPVIVMAGHGLRTKFTLQFALGEILLRLGVARRAPSPGLAWLPPAAGARLEPGLEWGWRHVPWTLRRGLERFRRTPGDGRTARLPSGNLRPPIDAANSQCFIVNNNHTVGALRVNLVGREPAGRIHPGAEYDRFVEGLERDLLAIVSTDTGRPVIDRIRRRSELFPGENLDHFPDLFIEWAATEPIRKIRSERIGTLAVEDTYCRTGGHVPRGWFVAHGPGFRAGSLASAVSILDFAPTICEVLGVPSEGFDGKPIAAIVEGARAQGAGPGAKHAGEHRTKVVQ